MSEDEHFSSDTAYGSFRSYVVASAQIGGNEDWPTEEETHQWFDWVKDRVLHEIALLAEDERAKVLHLVQYDRSCEGHWHFAIHAEVVE